MTGIYVLLLLIIGTANAEDPDPGEKPVLKEPEIYSLNIFSDIKYRFATTRVTSRIKNRGTEPQEAIFDVTLPNEAFITNLTIEEDGKIIMGEIKKKEEAKRQYEAAREAGESAGYIGTKHRETNRFKLAITVAAMSKISFNLTYQELLQRKHAHYEQVIYIDPGQPVTEMAITVKILESRNITDLRVPPLRNDVGADLIGLDSLTVIKYPTPKSAIIEFFPSPEDQKNQSKSGLAGRFVVQYDVERGMDAGDILVVNGYFVHFFAPVGLDPIPNDVLFILDNSGSMAGNKLKQLKEAMNSILAVMNEGDRINMMTFSGSTSMWQSKMMDITDEDNLEDAKMFVNKITARGSTNINLALTKGIKFMNDYFERDPQVRSPVIVFLTDGQATSGITNSNTILDNIRKDNEGSDVSIFSLAFGEHADYDLIKKVALQNNGFGKKIYEASDASIQIAGFYNEISMTLLKNLSFHYLDAPVSNLTKHVYENYFNGSELIICGKMESTDPLAQQDMTLQVNSKGLNGQTVLVLDNILEPQFEDPENLTKLGDYEMIFEKVWAYQTIKQLLDKELATSDSSEKLELKRRVLDLSLKYGFVTPLTSMVVTKGHKTDTRDTVAEDGDAVYDIPPRMPMGIGIGGKSIGSGYSRTDPSMYSGPQLHSVQSARRPAGLSPMPQAAADLSAAPDLLHMQRAPDSFQHPALNSAIPQAAADLSAAPELLHMQRAPDPFQHPALNSGPIPASLPKDHGRRNRKQKKRKNKGSKKGNKKDRQSKKAYSLPLQLTLKDVADPVCLSLYADQMVSHDTYLLYAEKVTMEESKVLVELEKRKFRKKMAGGIRSVTFEVGINRTKILSDNEGNLILNTTDGAMRQLDVPYEARLGGVQLSIASTQDGFLNILVSDHSNVSKDGILGSFLSNKIKPKIPKKKKKKYSLLKVNKTVVKMVRHTTVPFSDKSDMCLVAKKESVFYDLQQYKHSS